MVMISGDDLAIVVRVAASLAIGGLVGFERTFHGRPAGFRTHSLVCLASTLLMIITVYQNEWMTHVSLEAIRTDPTRMAQGIMTGIGFLGAGVIFKEGLTVRGLTTAASIWVTSALGILVGIGFYFLAAVGTVAALLVLAVFRVIEARFPAEHYWHHTIKFYRERALAEGAVVTIVQRHGFSVANIETRLTDGGRHIQYRMTLRNRDLSKAGGLVEDLTRLEEVAEFRVTPTGD